MSILTEKAYAKLNLCLAVGGKAPNGYHYIKSVMQSVSLFDTVQLETASGICLSCDNASLPTDGKNLAYRAAEAFFAASGIDGGVNISLQKSIPVCAGMGGGSADAAAVLRGLNKLYGNPLDTGALLTTAASLGTDVPFCVQGGTAYATGFGEKLCPLPNIKLYYVLITDSTPLSTPQMYQQLDEGFYPSVNASPCVEAVKEGKACEAAKHCCNSFLQLAAEKCPAVSTNIALLKSHGALSACITGKGPTVFGVFSDKALAEKASLKIKNSIFCESV